MNVGCCTPRRVAADSACALVAGLLMAGVHPPIAQPWLAWVALAPLIVACRGRAWWARMLLGLMTGLAYIGPTFHWLRLHDPALLFGALCTGASFFALFAAATALVESQPPRWSTPACYPVLWLALMRLYDAQPLGSYWAHYAGAGDPLLRQAAALGGASAMTAIVVIAACHAGRLAAERRRLPGCAWVGGLVLALLVYGAARLALPEPPGRAVTVAMVQPDLPERRDVTRILARYRGLTRQALQREARLIVWPQYGLEGVPLDAARMPAFLRQVGAPIRPFHLVLGTHERRGARRYLNIGQLYGGSGALEGEHLSVNLPPGRYWARAGSTVRPIDAGGESWGILLCYEDTTSRVARKLTRGGARLLLSLMNERRFRGTSQPAIHLELARVRAVENGRYLVRGSNSGPCAIIDSRGRIVGRTTPDRPELLVGQARLLDRRTPFSITGDWLQLAALVLASFLLLSRVRGVHDRTCSAS